MYIYMAGTWVSLNLQMIVLESTAPEESQFQ